MKQVLRSFRPVADAKAGVLILGSMPGPEALRKREYYGFAGNLFWKIMSEIFETHPLLNYEEKIRFLKERRIALWDVLKSCVREGAGDHHIRFAKPNGIGHFLRKFPGIQAVFLNGRTTEKMYHKYFAACVNIPAFYLPSTSPAHASMRYPEKLKRWRLIRRHLVRRNPQ